jgi:hypothetical protein
VPSKKQKKKPTEEQILKGWEKILEQFLKNGGKIELNAREKQQILEAQHAFESSQLSDFTLGGPMYKLLG